MATSFVDALGTGMFAPIAVLYLANVVGLSAVRIGLGVAIVGALGVATSPVVGTLVDRVDARTVTAIGFACSAAGFLVYTQVRSFAAFLLVGGSIQIFETTARGARKMVAFAVASGEDRITLLAYDRSTRNAAYAVGGLLASAALAGSAGAYTAVLLANALSYFVGAGAVLKLPRARPISTETPSGGYRVVVRDLPYVGLATLGAILWLNDSILQVGMAVWVIKRTTVPSYALGLLFTLNTLLVVALQVRASQGTGTPLGAGRAYLQGGLALAAACALFALSAGQPPLIATGVVVAAVVALTLGEIFSSAAQWGASVTLAKEELRGRYLALWGTGMSLQRAVGPAVITIALGRGGGWGWMLVGLTLLGMSIASRLVVSRASVPSAREEPIAEAA